MSDPDLIRHSAMTRKKRQTHHFPTTAADVIDRVLDKGIVVEYHARLAIGGIDTLVRIDARYIAASLTTYVRYAEPLRRAGLISASIGFDD